MSKFIAGLITFLSAYKFFLRGAGSVIELFPEGYSRKSLAKKYYFNGYISDDEAMYSDWNQVGTDLKSAINSKQFLLDKNK